MKDAKELFWFFLKKMQMTFKSASKADNSVNPFLPFLFSNIEN